MSLQPKTYNLKPKNGFTLIEVVVSLAILTTVMLSLHFVAQMAVRSWDTAQKRSVAYNIIQDAVESIRNIRDNNVATASEWFAGTDNASLNGVLMKPLPTGFTRDIVITDISSGIIYDGATIFKKKVIVTVSWTDKIGKKTLSETTYFTDWKGKY